MFSETENKVLDLLGKRSLTIGQLTDKYFKDCDRKPINPNAVVSGSILRINKKCEYHKLTWFINGVGLGRSGKKVWIDKQPKMKGAKRG